MNDFAVFIGITVGGSIVVYIALYLTTKKFFVVDKKSEVGK
jgi:hypothetical protein